jgi:hypothetical protein
MVNNVIHTIYLLYVCMYIYIYAHTTFFQSVLACVINPSYLPFWCRQGTGVRTIFQDGCTCCQPLAPTHGEEPLAFFEVTEWCAWNPPCQTLMDFDVRTLHRSARLPFEPPRSGPLYRRMAADFPAEYGDHDKWRVSEVRISWSKRQLNQFRHPNTVSWTLVCTSRQRLGSWWLIVTC